MVLKCPDTDVWRSPYLTAIRVMLLSCGKLLQLEVAGTQGQCQVQLEVAGTQGQCQVQQGPMLKTEALPALQESHSMKSCILQGMGSHASRISTTLWKGLPVSSSISSEEDVNHINHHTWHLNQPPKGPSTRVCYVFFSRTAQASSAVFETEANSPSLGFPLHCGRPS